MAKMAEDVVGLFNDPKALKVLATVGAEGKPNVAPKGTLMALNNEKIGFAEMMGKKTRENLKLNKKVAIAVFKGMSGYQVKGEFQGFQTEGALFDQVTRRVKEVLGTDIKEAGIIKVDEVYSLTPGPKAGEKLA
jgi:hypothetical protein